jgi:hypothetical protein
VFAELKTDAGRLSDAQERVVRDLRSAGASAEIWRPRDFADVKATLERREA